METGKVLAIDYGSKKVGVAISDSSRQLCFMRPFLPNKGLDNLASTLNSMCQTESISMLLIGLPLKDDSTLSKQALEIQSFVNDLKQVVNVPVVTLDESFSTFQASEIYSGSDFPKESFGELKDSLSAYVLLRRYLKLD